MDKIKITVRLLPSGKEVVVGVPENTLSSELITAILNREELNLPKFSQEKDLLKYELTSRDNSHRPIPLNTTMKEFGIKEGDTLLLSPVDFAAGGPGKSYKIRKLKEPKLTSELNKKKDKTITVLIRVLPSGREIKTSIALDSTPIQIIESLLYNDENKLDKFLPSGEKINYKFTNPGLDHTKTILEHQMKEGDYLTLIYDNNEAVNTLPLKKHSIPNLSFEEIVENKGAIQIILDRYYYLEKLSATQKNEIIHLKNKNKNKQIATTLLILAQIITALGANLVTGNTQGGWIVFFSGIIITFFSLYFSIWSK